MADAIEIPYKTQLTKIYHTNYVRNTRAITVLWSVFTVIFSILNVVVFIQPQWFGDIGGSDIPGFFGLYRSCELLTDGSDYTCTGDFLDFIDIDNPSLQAASFFVGGSALIFWLSVVCLSLFIFLHTTTVMKICGWMHIFGAIFMALGCIIYPNGWSSPMIQRVCGSEAGNYNIGICGLRWAYILAIILVVNAVALAVLAFVLAVKQASLLPSLDSNNKCDPD